MAKKPKAPPLSKTQQAIRDREQRTRESREPKAEASKD